MEYIYDEITYEELHEIYDNNEYEIEVESPSGWTKITNTFNKESSGYHITLQDGREIKCANSHFMMSDDWINANQLKIGDSILNKDNTKSLITNKTVLPNQTWYDFSVDNSNR